MKKIILISFTLAISSIAIMTTFVGCKKETITNTINKTDTIYKCTQNIQGLWEGTYTVGSGQPVPSGTQFYASFSIYPNGTLTYKAKGYYNGSVDFLVFAEGTWTLNGTAFSFSVKTINLPGGGSQHTQTGTATFNISNGTLTNGNIIDNDIPSNSFALSMSRVN